MAGGSGQPYRPTPARAASRTTQAGKGPSHRLPEHRHALPQVPPDIPQAGRMLRPDSPPSEAAGPAQDAGRRHGTSHRAQE